MHKSLKMPERNRPRICMAWYKFVGKIVFLLEFLICHQNVSKTGWWIDITISTFKLAWSLKYEVPTLYGIETNLGTVLSIFFFLLLLTLRLCFFSFSFGNGADFIYQVTQSLAFHSQWHADSREIEKNNHNGVPAGDFDVALSFAFLHHLLLMYITPDLLAEPNENAFNSSSKAHQGYFL